MSRNGFLNSPSLSFAPVIFLMTDGYPSDDYKAGLKELQANSWYKFGLKAALGIGSEANDNVLAEFTGSADSCSRLFRRTAGSDDQDHRCYLFSDRKQEYDAL